MDGKQLEVLAAAILQSSSPNIRKFALAMVEAYNDLEIRVEALEIEAKDTGATYG